MTQLAGDQLTVPPDLTRAEACSFGEGSMRIPSGGCCATPVRWSGVLRSTKAVRRWIGGRLPPVQRETIHRCLNRRRMACRSTAF